MKGCRLISPSNTIFDLLFDTQGHAATRMEFDNFLFNLACAENKTLHVFENTAVKNISCYNDNTAIETTNGETLTAQIIIGADGAQSVVAKQLANFSVNKNYYIGAVRAYYKNILDVETDLLEIHFLKNYMPGYFWIFPLQNNMANVGFGMASNYIAKRKIDLRKSLSEIIETVPTLIKRFAQAQCISPATGFGLPTGGRKLSISGNNFLLCGDAASLINPATGEGIGNAMISGRLAAEQVLKCFKENNFSSSFNKQYDRAVYKKLHSDLRIQHIIQKIVGNKEWLVNFALKQISKHEVIRKRVQKFF